MMDRRFTMFFKFILCIVSSWICFAAGVTISPLAKGSVDVLHNKTHGPANGDVETDISPIIVTCVVLSIAFFFIILLVHFIRRGSCERIIDSFKLTNYQLKFSLPKISLKGKKKNTVLCATSKKILLLEESNSSCEDPTQIIKAEPEKCDKRSSRIFDVFRSKLDRNSSIMTASTNHLFIVHKEVENFEEEALSLLSSVMSKHLDPEVEPYGDNEEASTSHQSIHSSTKSLLGNNNIDDSTVIGSDGEFEITYLDDSDGPITSL